MYCKNCGHELCDEAVICTNCGVAVANIVKSEEKKNGMAIAGFVCSFFIPLLGWIFGGVGLSKSYKLDGKGKGLSIGALVIATIMFFVRHCCSIISVVMLKILTRENSISAPSG